MEDESGLVALRRDLPEFLQSEAVCLVFAFPVKPEPPDGLLAETASATFRKERKGAPEFDTGLPRRAARTVRCKPHVACCNPRHPVPVREQFGRREAGEDRSAHALGRTRQPAAQVAETDDVVAVVPHGRRQEGVRPGEAAPGAQEQEPFLADLGLYRCVERTPVRNEFVEAARVEDCT